MTNPTDKSMSSLLIPLIKDLVIEFKPNPNVIAMILTGSYVNKTYKPYSDVDITVFFKDVSQAGFEYDLRYYNDTLVSLTSANIDIWEESLRDAKTLMFRYRPILNSIILIDRNHEFEKFTKRITPTPWVYAEQDRKRRIEKLAIGYIEEVHKLLNMLIEFDESTAVNALYSLSLGMAEIMALHYKLLFESENEYFDHIQDSVGWNSKWTQLFRDALNLQLVGEYKTIDMKITTGLLLFQETMSTIQLRGAASDPISKAMKLINLRLLKPS